MKPRTPVWLFQPLCTQCSLSQALPGDAEKFHSGTDPELKFPALSHGDKEAHRQQNSITLGRATTGLAGGSPRKWEWMKGHIQFHGYDLKERSLLRPSSAREPTQWKANFSKTNPHFLACSPLFMRHCWHNS